MTSTSQQSTLYSEHASSTEPTASSAQPSLGSNLAATRQSSLPTASATFEPHPNAFEPSNMSTVVGGAQHTHNSSESVNGRNPTIPAIPSINGNNSFSAGHNRKPSMTVTPAGTTTFSANGVAPGGNQNKTNIRFGSVNDLVNSPSMDPPPTLAHQSSSSLAVSQLNPRMTSPSSSPSPIPQPNHASGGRPPSSLQGQGNGMVFGASGPSDQSDHSGLSRPLTHLQFGQNEHMRRGSSQSIHSETGNATLPTGPSTRGGYGMHGGGRGRGNNYSAPYQQQMPYAQHQSYRGGPNNRGMPSNFAGRAQFQGSPGMGTRSPAMMNAVPGNPQMNQMHMMPQMQGQAPNGFYMAQQVKPHAPNPQETTRGKPGKARGRAASRGRGRGAGRGAPEDRPRFSRDPASEHYRPELVHAVDLYPFPDLSPESGNFEHFLTQRAQQGMNVPTAADPSIQMMYNQQMQYPQAMPNQYPGYMPPQSPRPPFQQSAYPPHMQPTYSNQGQPQSMSRQSSQMSMPERPGSSVGQQPHTPSISTPSVVQHANTRTPSMSAQKSNFAVPAKKNAAIQIKNAAGEIVNFNKPPASPATSTPTSAAPPPAPPAAALTPSAPTPPSRPESAAEASHARTESVNTKSVEEKKKSMQEAVKQRVEEQNKLKQMESHAEEKADIDEEARDIAEEEGEEAGERAETLENEASEAEAAPAKESNPSAALTEGTSRPEPEDTTKAESDETTQPESEVKPTLPDDDEIDFDAIEAEMAAAEAEEARLEAEFQKKKAAEQEARRKREAEEAAAYEADMKEMERRAEEEELSREKEREAGSGDEAAKRMFAELKSASGAATPGSTDTPAIATPGESGTATPVSEVSMPPPAKGMGPKRAKAAELILDTKKIVEPPEPSATLKALQTAKKVDDLSKVTYPSEVAPPDTTLNQNASANRGFKYDQAFLLQFQSIFKEKPSLDWDAKIRDALGDGDSSARPSASARTPSGMGRSMSNRPAPPANAFGPMGAFAGQPRPLPPGTTSEQRFAASNAAMRGAPIAQNPFAQFGRGTMAAPMARNPSSNALGPIPGSPRVGGSRGGSRAESKRSKQNYKQSAEENKSMPLTAGLAIPSLETTSTGWKPRSVGQPTLGPTPGGSDGLMDPETVQRKVKAALNKMAPEKFDRIADQILEIAAQSKNETDGRTLRQVIQLTFEKATDEAHWAPMYAMFCRKMLESMSNEIKDENIKDRSGAVVVGGNLFRKYLLNRCQEEFERGWKVNLPPRPEGQTEEAALLSDEYYIAAAAKRRGLGLVKFIGELFKLGMLTERIMHECVKKLVDYEGLPEEAEVESLTSLLRTIGRQLDDPQSKAQGRMDVYFERIKSTIELPDLPSRQKFMLMDIVDLRRKGWISKDDNKGPKTIGEIRAEAERAAHEAELSRLAQQSQRGGRGGPMPMGRGDARSFSSYGQQVPPPDNSGRVGADDLRRLSNRPARNASNNAPASLGPTSLLGGGRTNSGRRGLGPGGLMTRGDESGASSRTGTPPASKDKEKKDEASTNAFSALASLDNEGPSSNPASPPSQPSQPNIERARSRSPATNNE